MDQVTPDAPIGHLNVYYELSGMNNYTRRPYVSKYTTTSLNYQFNIIKLLIKSNHCSTRSCGVLYTLSLISNLGDPVAWLS
jgi:hypothetical protein